MGFKAKVEKIASASCYFVCWLLDCVCYYLKLYNHISCSIGKPTRSRSSFSTVQGVLAVEKPIPPDLEHFFQLFLVYNLLYLLFIIF